MNYFSKSMKILSYSININIILTILKQCTYLSYSKT